MNQEKAFELMPRLTKFKFDEVKLFLKDKDYILQITDTYLDMVQLAGILELTNELKLNSLTITASFIEDHKIEMMLI